MKLGDFNNIDINNAGSLPVPVKVVLLTSVFLIILGLGIYFLLIPSFDSLGTVKAKELELRQVFLDKKSQAINLAAYKQQMVEIEKTFGALLKQLPDKSQMDGLLTDINQAGLGRGLEFESFKPGQETQAEFYAEMPIYIKVTGTYHELGAFATDISKLSRIVTLNDISLVLVNKDAKSAATDARLEMVATARTYRYLDSNELEAKRKSDSTGKIKTGGKG